MDTKELSVISNTSEAYSMVDYSKSNLLIGAKYKSSLLENKILAIAFSRINECVYTDNGNLECSFPAAELRMLLDANKGSFYNQLNTVAIQMTGRSIGISNPEMEAFEYMAVVPYASYKDGIFTIEFNHKLSNYLTNITKNFTKLNLPIMLSFDNVYSFRLYELLKSKAYYPKGVEKKDNLFKISIGLAELKLSLGVVNAELDKVKKELNGKKKPDFERAVEISPEKILETWYDFKRKVLDKATNEINEKTDIGVTYVPLKSGRGAKVYQVDFYVELRDKKKSSADDMNDAEKDIVLDEIMKLIEEPLSISDIRAVAEAADYDVEKIKSAYEVLKSTSSTIDNVVGFLLTAIHSGYKKVEKKPKRKNQSTKNKFNQFTQNEYVDWDEIEKDIVSNI